MSNYQCQVFSIGHSNHSSKSFLALLDMHLIEAIIDVRSAPYSGYTPHFNHDFLRDMLEDHKIGYYFLGGELGGRPADRGCYDAEGRVQYDLVSETDLFQDGIRSAIRLAEDVPIALMCTEKDPLECHRTLLVSNTLSQNGICIQHILADGRLESHDASMDRLLNTLKLPPYGDLFRSRDEVIEEALFQQAQKVAYVNRELSMGRNMWTETF